MVSDWEHIINHNRAFPGTEDAGFSWFFHVFELCYSMRGTTIQEEEEGEPFIDVLHQHSARRPPICKKNPCQAKCQLLEKVLCLSRLQILTVQGLNDVMDLWWVGWALEHQNRNLKNTNTERKSWTDELLKHWQEGPRERPRNVHSKRALRKYFAIGRWAPLGNTGVIQQSERTGSEVSYDWFQSTKQRESSELVSTYQAIWWLNLKPNSKHPIVPVHFLPIGLVIAFLKGQLGHQPGELPGNACFFDTPFKDTIQEWNTNDQIYHPRLILDKVADQATYQHSSHALNTSLGTTLSFKSSKDRPVRFSWFSCPPQANQIYNQHVNEDGHCAFCLKTHPN